MWFRPSFCYVMSPAGGGGLVVSWPLVRDLCILSCTQSPSAGYITDPPPPPSPAEWSLAPQLHLKPPWHDKLSFSSETKQQTISTNKIMTVCTLMAHNFLLLTDALPAFSSRDISFSVDPIAGWLLLITVQTAPFCIRQSAFSKPIPVAVWTNWCDRQTDRRTDSWRRSESRLLWRHFVRPLRTTLVQSRQHGNKSSTFFRL